MKTAAQILEERFEPNGFSLKKALGLQEDASLIADPAYKRILFAMRIYAEQTIEEAALNAGILETTAYSESKEIVCKNHDKIINHSQGIVNTIQVDKGTILIIKQRLQ